MALGPRGEWHRKVLADLFNEREFKIVAEVGVFSGTLCDYLLERCPSVESYCAIDLWQPVKTKGSGSLRRFSQAKWDEIHDLFLAVMHKYPQVHEFREDSLVAATRFRKACFDFVFLDADHGYESVKPEIVAWLPLVRKGGVIAGHDFRKKYPGVKQAVEECFPGSFTILPRRSSVWMHEVT